ncbi:MAG: DNA-directed RNA polymerase subunit beta [Bacilli bacterium]
MKILEKDYKVMNNNRIDFSKVSGKLELPYLVEIQTKSFGWFIEHGLDEVFKDVFPIKSQDGSIQIEYESFVLEEPKYDALECKARDLTYSKSLKATVRLNYMTTGQIKESTVFMGELPVMTPSGTFIVNGAERVIVSQIVRSPGAYLAKTRDKTGKFTFNADLIPSRGTWLEFESDGKGILSVRIDRQRKMPATTLLKALGFTKYEDVVAIFGETEDLAQTWEKDVDIKNEKDALKEIFKKLKPGEPITDKGITEFLIQKFFDEKRYDIGNAGRYKYNKKLGPYNRLIDKILAEDLISVDGEVIFEKDHLLTKDDISRLKRIENGPDSPKGFFETGAHKLTLENINTNLDTHADVYIVKVYADDSKSKVVNIVGNDIMENIHRVTISDIAATFSAFLNIMQEVGETDDIDNLANRRIRCIGELLQTQFRIGLTKMAKTVTQKISISSAEDLTLQSLLNVKPLTSAIREFFASSQLSQFMDQTNPLAELTNKRRISALGPGGLTRDRASMEVRDVHFTHYGRICPIETPEGQNIGLINNLACYAKVNTYGFIETPYRRVAHETVNGETKARVTEENIYFSADQERNHNIAQANARLDKDGYFIDKESVARSNGENVLCDVNSIDYIDVSPKQIISVAAACIPFLENDDNTRALMGANMQRQALPLLHPEAPFVGTGMEHIIAHDSGLAVTAKISGRVIYVDSQKITIQNDTGDIIEHKLQKFDRSNNGTCINQKPIVKIGQDIKYGDIIADGPAMDNGDLALGQNVTIAFMTWNGYNYEDAVIMSQRLVKDDTYTSIHIESYELECRVTKLGNETITRDIPNTSEAAKAHLDKRGIIVIGSEVKEGDILVGKITPKGQNEPTPEEKLFQAIFGDKSKEGKDSSLRVPHGGAGIVVDVKIFSVKAKDELSPNVLEKVRVYIAQKRKISEGDKMSGRHGNKGVISRILPVEDMPYLPDGTPVDIMLNPCGVPSRMNIGQILELHLGLACKKLGIKVATPVFDGISNEELLEIMKKADLNTDGKTVLFDGRTGERFDERISVGVMYMIKLVHMVDDKLHARATGPYSLVTQQPLGGKAQNGGQRFGEMEVWALEAYGAAHVLQEILTIKSDDRVGRRKTYAAIIKGTELPKPSIPEAYRVFVKELKGLALDVTLFDQYNEMIDMDDLARQTSKEEKRAMKSIRTYNSETEENAEGTDQIVDESNVNEMLGN